ncbi:hypothetical protein [Streptomyces sp. NPDC052496]|uniref:hypothetical protein n=1 Tax=Streptomyces sp. NPDC052496 TaxID=3154951 RepID=UPI00342A739B
MCCTGVPVGRNKELMTALLNVRRTLAEEISGLDRRLDDSRHEVLERLTAEAAELRRDSREARDHADRNTAAATETERAVTLLRQEISAVRQSVAGIQQSLDALARHPVFDTEADGRPEAPDDGEDGGDGAGDAEESEWTGPDLIDAGQEPPFPPLADGDDGEDGHDERDAGSDAECGVETSADSGARDDAGSNAPSGQDDPGIDHPGHPGHLDHERIRRETQEDVDHGVLLLKAAQAGPVVLVCHREAWEFFAACATGNEHFRSAYELADEGNGRVRAVLSGRSVIGALTALRRTRDDSHLDGTWALASAFYSRLAEGLRGTARDGRRPLTVVFDDGVRGAAAGPDTDSGAARTPDA